MPRRILRAVRRRFPRAPGRASLCELVGRPPPLPTSRVAADGVAIDEVDVLRPLADAGAGRTAWDLLRPPPGTYHRAPNPKAWQEARHAVHAALPAIAGVRLRVLTFNVALLFRTYLGRTVESPHRAERRPALVETIFGGDWDVLFLQEVWNDEDARVFEEAARAAGYAVHTGDRRYNHGLMLCVRRAAIVQEERDEGLYATQYHLEAAPGPSIKRGFLRWSFDGPWGRVTLYDTHTSAFPWASSRRNMQARELGLEVARRPDCELVLVGGDLNAAVFYARDRRPNPNPRGRDTLRWWSNAASVPLLMHYGGLDDAFNLAGPARDVDRGRDLPGALHRRPEHPMSRADFCSNFPRDTFTATDCNTLYFRQYGGTEFPARIDHVLLRDPSLRARVRGARVVFQDRRDLGASEPIELSDHYGVSVEMDVVPGA